MVKQKRNNILIILILL